VAGACAGALVVVGAGVGLFVLLRGPDPAPAAKEEKEPPAARQGPVAIAPKPPPAREAREGFAGILDDFRADAAGADRRHAGRAVTLSGVVQSAEWADPSSAGPHAILTVDGEKGLVVAFFPKGQADDVLALKPGRVARLRGEVLKGSFGGGVVNVALDRCELLSPLASAQAKLQPPKVEVPAVEVAPAPRRVYNPAPDGRSSEWVRCGAVEVRVRGARVGRPVFLDAQGAEVTAPDPLLLVWVEARRVRAGQTELRRWVGALSSAATLREDGKRPLPEVRPPGVVPEQLQAPVKLRPGEPAVLDVMAFTPPKPSATGLTLRLAARHVGESGDFYFDIPRSFWEPNR
jgi:hypothetical protein